MDFKISVQLHKSYWKRKDRLNKSKVSSSVVMYQIFKTVESKAIRDECERVGVVVSFLNDYIGIFNSHRLTRFYPKERLLFVQISQQKTHIQAYIRTQKRTRSYTEEDLHGIK